MIQDIPGHALGGREHPAFILAGSIELTVSSTHHQLMVAPSTSTILMEAGEIPEGQWPRSAKNHVEPEVIQHPDGDLSVQYHPEWMAPDSVGWLYFRKLVSELIDKRKLN